jgi:aromatic-L-amino-acid decarboxylase
VDPETFRRVGHRLVDWIADYRAGVEARPVRAALEPGAVKARLPASPPEHGEPPDALIDDLERVVMPGITHWQHPSFFGWFPATADLSSVLGDLASSGLGVIGLSWLASPALTEVEEVVVDWTRQLVGLSPAWCGALQDTASTSTLVALLCARERVTGYTFGGGAPTVVYASTQAHSSVRKAALLAGMRYHEVGVDAAWALDPAALTAAIEADRAAGLVPAAIVLTTGTTTTTAMDPIAPVAPIAEQFGAWLHVDAAMAGAAMLLPEQRRWWAGIEAADSIVWNAHKWLGVVFDASIFLVRDRDHLTRVLSTNPSYLRTPMDDRVANLRDWGIPLGRRFRALKLWFLLRSEGAEGLRARMRRDLANAAWLADQVAATPGWHLVAPAPLQTLCVRHEPDGLGGDALDAHTLAWAERVNSSGAALVTPAQLDGRWMVRVSVGALGTERAHVEALWALMQRVAA